MANIKKVYLCENIRLKKFNHSCYTRLKTPFNKMVLIMKSYIMVIITEKLTYPLYRQSETIGLLTIYFEVSCKLTNTISK